MEVKTEVLETNKPPFSVYCFNEKFLLLLCSSLCHYNGYFAFTHNNSTNIFY